MSFEFLHTFPAVAYNSGSGLTISTANWDFRSIPATSVAGIHTLRRLTVRIKGTATMSTGSATCTFQPAAVVSNINLTVPGAPMAQTISMPGMSLVQINRLEAGGDYLGTSLVNGVKQNALYDGYQFTSSSGLTVPIDFELPLSWERPLDENPDAYIIPVSALQKGASISVTLADPVGIGVAYGTNSNIASFAGTVSLEAAMVALLSVQVPAWSAWVTDNIPSTTVQSNGITRYPGGTLVSGIGIAAVSAKNMSSSDLTQLGYATGAYQRTQNGTATSVWYSRFNAANPDNTLIPHTDFVSSTLAYSQTLPLVFAAHRIGGQTLADGVEPSSAQVNFLADTFANAAANYQLVRRVALAHASGHQAVRSLAGVPASAAGHQVLSPHAQNAVGAGGINGALAKALSPFRFLIK